MRHTLIFLVWTSLALAADKYTIDASHSKVGFEISHLVISTVEGQFKKFEGSYSFDEKTQKVSNIEFSIDAASIDTNEKDRDNHLRSDDFFNVEKFPKIHFKDVQVRFKDGKPFKVIGILNMAGKTKPIVLDVKWLGQAEDPWGNVKQAFVLSGKIKREDFGLTWNKKLDKGGFMIGDEATLRIRIQGSKEP